MSPLVATGAAPAPAAEESRGDPGAAPPDVRAFGLGSSFHSSIAAFEMQTSPVSSILQRKMIRVSLSFHISVLIACPGSTLVANRTLIDLMYSGLPSGAHAPATWRVA